jgi:hypothetical protein
MVNAVTKIETVEKRTLWGYKGDDYTPFMKITVTDPKAVPRVRDECELSRGVTSVLLTFERFHVFSKRERLTSEAYSLDRSRPMKAIFHSFCVS